MAHNDEYDANLLNKILHVKTFQSLTKLVYPFDENEFKKINTLTLMSTLN